MEKSNFQLFLFLLFSIFYVSCNKESPSSNTQKKDLAELRGAGLGIAKCCSLVTYKIRNLSSENNCCISEVTITNNSSCKYYLYNINNQLIAVVPPFTSKKVKLTSCNDETAINSYYIGTAVGDKCKEFTLNPICSFDCTCEGATISAFYTGMTNGCCVYEINGKKLSNCPMLLYDATGKVYYVQLANQSNCTLPITICSPVTLYYGPNINISDACASIQLNCPF